MPTLRSALKAGDLPPKAHLIHIALTELGEGEYTAAEIADVLGYPKQGRYLGRIIAGAKRLRAKGRIAIAKGDRIVAGPEYAKRKAVKDA